MAGAPAYSMVVDPQPQIGAHLSRNSHFKMTAGDVGILRSTILPSFGLYSGLSAATYLAAQATDRAEGKDWLWPSAQVLNAWLTAVGRPMYEHGLTFSDAINTLTWSEKLLLGGVTIWGTRLFARIASRSLVRGKDDSRYDTPKKDPGFWKGAFFKMFLPEAAVLSIIALPYTVPFVASQTTLTLGADTLNAIRALGVGLFSSGFALEVMADSQLERHRQERSDLCRHGVWSIVRHPNYLGDSLVHLSFVVMNITNNFNPLVLLGPLTNYLFLRFVGGDKQTEQSQEERYREKAPEKYEQLCDWRKEKNSFWPSLREINNPWALAVIGCGFLGVGLEKVLRQSVAV